MDRGKTRNAVLWTPKLNEGNIWETDSERKRSRAVEAIATSMHAYVAKKKLVGKDIITASERSRKRVLDARVVRRHRLGRRVRRPRLASRVERVVVDQVLQLGVALQDLDGEAFGRVLFRVLGRHETVERDDLGKG